MRARIVLACVGALLLAGCGASSEESIHDWMARQHAQVRPVTEPIAPPRKFTPQPYLGTVTPDPFNPQRLTQSMRQDPLHSASAALVLPERHRPRQPLEEFPLESMTMVGSLVSQGLPTALVRVEKSVYAVRAGAYLGQNYGKVVRVTEKQVVLREIVQDASGVWVAREASLQLQEGGK